jgi:hypothetical protein
MAKPRAQSAKAKALSVTKAKSDQPATGSNVIPVHLDGKPRGRRLAEVATEPAAAAAAVAGWMTQGTFGPTEIGDLVGVLRDSVKAAQEGNLGEYEGMLGAQAYALNAIFLEMTRRAALNLGTHLGATEQYMRLALKAQSQARTTIETLAEVKNPRPVAFVRQANIAQNQQINNGAIEQAPPAPAIESPQTKLLEASNVTRLDTRAQSGAGRSNPPLEAVGSVNRTKVRRRQGAG